MATAAVTHNFVNGTNADADEVDQNFTDLVSFVNNSVIHADGSKVFTAVVSGVTPTAAAHLATKGYVDDVVKGTRVFVTTSNIVSTTGVVEVIAFNAEQTDDGNWHSNSTNNTRVTVDTDGWYDIKGQVGFEANATGRRRVRILINGTANSNHEAEPASGAGIHYLPASPLDIYLTAGDYVELEALQTSGGDLDLQNGSAATWLSVVRKGY